MLKGIAASAGVSVAKVYKLETPKVVIEKKAGVAEEEVKKFEDALEKTKKDKFINDVIECFDNKINIIRNIVYNYNLLDIIPNLTTMSDD